MRSLIAGRFNASALVSTAITGTDHQSYQNYLTMTMTMKLPTIPSIAFIKKHLFSSQNWSLIISHWEAIPRHPLMSILSCTQVCFETYQIAWRRFSNFSSPVRPAKNFFIRSSSFTDAASKPRESWKINLELLWKISSSSMLCSPLWIWWSGCLCDWQSRSSNSPLVTHARF